MVYEKYSPDDLAKELNKLAKQGVFMIRINDEDCINVKSVKWNNNTCRFMLYGKDPIPIISINKSKKKFSEVIGFKTNTG